MRNPRPTHLSASRAMPGLVRLAAVVSVVASAAATAPAAVAAEPIAGTMQVDAPASGWVAVTIPEPLLVIDDGELAIDVAINGGNQFREFALRREVPEANGRYPTLAVQEYHERVVRSTHDKLPPGVYRLYVVAGDNGRLQLRIPGRTGSASLSVTTPVTLFALPSRRNVSFASSDGVLSTIAYAYYNGERAADGYFRVSYWSGYRAEICHASEDVDYHSSYRTGCPGGSTRVGESADYALFHGGGGHVGYGANVGPDAFAPPSVEIAGFAFEFDDPPLQTATPPQPAKVPALWASLPSGRVTVRRGKARVPVRCDAEQTCRGRLILGSRARAFAVEPGRTALVPIAAPRRAERARVMLAGRTADGAVTVERLVRLVRGAPR